MYNENNHIYAECPDCGENTLVNADNPEELYCENGCCEGEIIFALHPNYVPANGYY